MHGHGALMKIAIMRHSMREWISGMSMSPHGRVIRVYAGCRHLRSVIAAACVLIPLCAVSCGSGSAIQKAQDYNDNNPPAINSFHAYNADGSEIDAGRIEPFSVYNLYVAANDPDGDVLSYAFNSVSGSFSEVVSNAAGCSAVFKTGNIAGGQEVIAELTVTDKRGGTARSKLSVGSGKLGPTIIINYDRNKIRPDGAVTLTVSANCSGLFQVKPNSDNAITAGNLSSVIIDFTKDIMIYSASDNATTTIITGPTSGALGNIQLPSKAEYKDDTVYNVALVFLDGLNQRDAIICPIAVDGTAPSVRSHFPADGSSFVSATPDISITFSEPVMNIDDTFLSFELTGGNVGSITRKSYNSATNTIVYSVTGLDSNKNYTAIVKGAKDALGNTMTVEKTFSFTTSPEPVLTYYGNNNNGGDVPASEHYVLNANAVVSGNTRNLVKTGYTFAGWSNNASATTADYLPGSVVRMTGDLSLYAVWTPKQCTVAFDPKGGTMTSPEPITVTYDDSYTASPGWSGKTPTRSGYTFAGWWLSEGYTSGSKIIDSTLVSNDSNHTVYAKWDYAPVMVSFNSQGGSTVSAISCTPGCAYGTLGTPTWAGHNFSGWYTEASGGTQVTASTIVSNTAAHTLYAHWNAAQYTVSFDLNGGSGTVPSPITVTYGGVYSSFSSPVRDKYAFTGWYDSASGGTLIQTGDTVGITNNTTLYAHWNPNLVTSITLDKTIVYTSYGVGTTDITATVNGNPLNGAFTWSSSNTSLATVNASGTSCTVTIQPYDNQTTDRTVTITASAQDGSGKSAACSVVIQPELPISGTAGLEFVRTHLGGRFKLTGNIDLGNAEWTPLGATDAAPFAGYFDGNGFCISGIKISPPLKDNCGLFGVNQGVIKNLRVDSTSINGGQYCGIIAGKNVYADENHVGTIEKCIAGSGDQSTGGGSADLNCNVTGSAYVGGFVGSNSGKIIKSQSYAQVASTASGDVFVGGFIGENIYIVENCCAFGDVAAQNGNRVGGFYGYTQGTTNNCYARGAVWGIGYCSGFVGCAYLANISTCYSSGAVTLTGTATKRDNFIGDAIVPYDQTHITNCYTDGQGSATVAVPPCATSITTAQMKNLMGYGGWNIGSASSTGYIWKINDGMSYPYLNQDVW